MFEDNDLKFSPSLQQVLYRNILKILIFFGAINLALISSVYFASNFGPAIVHRNYDSIEAGIHMWRIWENYRTSKDRNRLAEQFKKELAFAQSNITELGEKNALVNIVSAWSELKENNDPLKWQQLNSQFHSGIKQLIEVNQRGMFRLATEAQNLRVRVMLCSLFLFAALAAWTIYLTDGLANRISKPISKIALILKKKPSYQYPLTLPEGSTSEVLILTKELKKLWAHLGEVEKTNVLELMHQKNQLQTILTSVEDAVFVCDENERIITCNSLFLALIQLDKLLVLGFKWSDLSTQNPNYNLIKTALGKPELNDPNTTIEIEIPQENQPAIYALRKRLISADHNQRGGTVYLMHDITHTSLKDKLKQEMLGVLSHEIKTPLQSMGLASDLLNERKAKWDEESQTLLQTLNEDIKRIKFIVQDFMRLSRFPQMLLKMNFQQVNLATEIIEWLRPFKILCQEKSIELEFENKMNVGTQVAIDPVKFPWVISNILANAVRVAPVTSKISLKIFFTTHKNIRIECIDQGPGVPLPLQEEIFKPFVQSPQSEQNAAYLRGSLGLGLSIAKEVVEAHQGKIGYIPNKPVGSIFWLEIPQSHLI